MPTLAKSDEAGREVYKPFPGASNLGFRTMMEPKVFSARAVQPYSLIRETRSISARVEEPSPETLPERKPWKDIGSSRVRALEAIQRALGRFYHLRDPVEILRFLGRNEFLIPFLLRMYPALRRNFGTRVIYLEVIADPEFEDERLGIFVAVDGASDKVLDLLGRFDEEWWPDVPSWLERNLIVSVEFE